MGENKSVSMRLLPFYLFTDTSLLLQTCDRNWLSCTLNIITLTVGPEEAAPVHHGLVSLELECAFLNSNLQEV